MHSALPFSNLFSKPLSLGCSWRSLWSVGCGPGALWAETSRGLVSPSFASLGAVIWRWSVPASCYLRDTCTRPSQTIKPTCEWDHISDLCRRTILLNSTKILDSLNNEQMKACYIRKIWYLTIMKNQFWVGQHSPSEVQNPICCDHRPLVKGKATMIHWHNSVFLASGEIINWINLQAVGHTPGAHFIECSTLMTD